LAEIAEAPRPSIRARVDGAAKMRERTMPGGVVELRVEVTPAWSFRLSRQGGMDGVLRCRGGVLERLLHYEQEPVHVRVAQTAPDAVLFGARSHSPAAARYGIERMRFALGVDDDLSSFHRELADDPLIGRSVRARPWLRVRRRPEPFEALAWAICEQLIEYERAAAIQRRIVAAMGPRWDGWDAATPPHRDMATPPHRDAAIAPRRDMATASHWGTATAPGHGHRGGHVGALRDVPSAGTLAGAAPARLQSFDLSETRARLLVRVAREVACGRVDLYEPDHERAWRRLRAIPGIGPWTVEMLALKGQGRDDQLPAGDLGLLKYVGRRLSGGDPHVCAGEDDVRSFFAPYGRWRGLAALHALTGSAPGAGGHRPAVGV
jgi:3-methyladenine DNA glycosylase/8-oxoguanine DNA glycosylase